MEAQLTVARVGGPSAHQPDRVFDSSNVRRRRPRRRQFERVAASVAAFLGGMLVLQTGICLAKTQPTSVDTGPATSSSPEPVPATVAGPIPRPGACLDLLESRGGDSAGGSPSLGRVIERGGIMEPVLIWENGGAGYSFRDCSSGEPVVSSVGGSDGEEFESAFVARFQEQTTGALKTYRKSAGLGYAPAGETRLRFREPGGMLEARRTDDRYVEVIGTDSVSIVGEGIPVLVVATRDAMTEMEPKIWEEPWGDRPEDSRIRREIIWWELLGSYRLGIHPVVQSFEELAALIAERAPADGTGWSLVVEEDSEAILARAAYSLIVVEEPQHLDLAEEMLERARKVNSADLDIAKLYKERREDKRDGWTKESLIRLEETAARGRFLRLSAFYDLAAYMPDRLAGKIRTHSRVTQDSSADEGRFPKDRLILATDTGQFQIANALFQDQAASMARAMSFLRCLLEDSSLEPRDRLELLRQGLEMMGAPYEDLRAETEVRETFQKIFQGFDLPIGLPVGDRLFLGSVRRQDVTLLRLVRSLQDALGTDLEPDPSCKIVLIPDQALSDPSGVKLELVAGIPRLAADEKPRDQPDLYDEVQEAKKGARRALERAIYVKAAVHAKARMLKGHDKLKEGVKLVDEKELGQALRAFEEAAEIFHEAREKAIKKEASMSPVRVF